MLMTVYVLLEGMKMYRFRVKLVAMNKVTLLAAVSLLLLSSHSMAGVVIVEDANAARTEKERQERQRNDRDSLYTRDDNDSRSSQTSQSNDGKSSGTSSKKKPNSNLIFGF